mgnify:CR=1 FL=1
MARKKPTKKKNAAAQALIAIRWKATSEEDRIAHAAMMGKSSAAAMTPEQRVARAKKAVVAREAKRKKTTATKK